MKTAEEWLMVYFRTHLVTDIEGCAQTLSPKEQFIRAIQLDAMKEGARRAAEITGQYNNRNDTWGGGLLCGKRQAILTAAEQWTEKDL